MSAPRPWRARVRRGAFAVALGVLAFAGLAALVRGAGAAAGEHDTPAPGSAALADPLAGIALADDAGRTWRLDDLRDAPVLIVVAERKAADAAHAWGARLAAQDLPLAPWRTPGKVTWLSIADLRRVPDYARDAARDGIREREAKRAAPDRDRRSPLLLDWEGVVAERLALGGTPVTVVLLGADHGRLARFDDTPTDEAAARLGRAINDAVGR